MRMPRGQTARRAECRGGGGGGRVFGEEGGEEEEGEGEGEGVVVEEKSSVATEAAESG
jgi:hypothetical protein